MEQMIPTRLTISQWKLFLSQPVYGLSASAGLQAQCISGIIEKVSILVLVVLVFPDAASVRQTPEFEKREFDPALALTRLPATLSHPMGEGKCQRQFRLHQRFKSLCSLRSLR
jgi:hypothetical protein